VRTMNDDMISWVLTVGSTLLVLTARNHKLGSQCAKSSSTHDFRKATLVLLKTKRRKKPEGKMPALFAIESYLTGWSSFRLLCEFYLQLPVGPLVIWFFGFWFVIHRKVSNPIMTGIHTSGAQ